MRTLQMRQTQVRANEDGTLTLEGVAVPYGEAIEYDGVREQFAPGTFTLPEVVGKPLLWSHDRAEPVGHITSAEDAKDGLRVEAVVQPTVRGKDAITLLRSGSLRGLSIGFDPTEWTSADDGSITYTRAQLHELSLTPLNAYPSAEVTATRDKEQTMPETQTVDLAPITDRIDQLEARMTAPVTTQPRTLSVREAFTMHIADVVNRREVRALADVISSGNSGVLPPQWSSEVRNVVDSNRYLIPRLGSVAFPASGYTLAFPKVTQHTLVAARGAEKTDIPSRALTTGQDFYTATWYAGGVDISQELISQSDPGVFGISVEDLFQQYAITTDTAVTLAMETNATATGSVLDFTSYKTFVDKIWAASMAILAATGQPGNLLSMTPTSFGKLIGLVDADGRRILSTTGSTNADGSASLTDTSVNVGGITCFFNPRATKDLQFNAYAARVAEKPPLQVSSVNVTKMGVDVGILGAVMDLPLYPNGIKRHAATTAADEAAAAKK